jgi:TDG/mug DNA glycosylase family protein
MLEQSTATCGLRMSERAQQTQPAQPEGQVCPTPTSSIGHRLPDLLAPNLRVVFVGTAAGKRSAELGHYNAGHGNRFWRTLHEVRLTPRRFKPAEFGDLLALGIGLTDMSKLGAGMDRQLARHEFNRDRLAETIRCCRPRAIAFNGKKAASIWLGRKRTEAVSYGRQPPALPDFPTSSSCHPPQVPRAPAGASPPGTRSPSGSTGHGPGKANRADRRPAPYRTPFSASSTEMPSFSSPSSR